MALEPKDARWVVTICKGLHVEDPVAKGAIDGLCSVVEGLLTERENDHGRWIKLQDLGNALAINIEPGQDVIYTIRELIANMRNKIAYNGRPFHYTPVTTQSVTVQGLMNESKNLPLYKMGDMRLVWINQSDLIALEMTGQAAKVTEGSQ